MLVEIAKVYRTLAKERLGYEVLTDRTSRYANVWYTELQTIIFRLMKRDPLGAYVELQRLQRREQQTFNKTLDRRIANSIQKFIEVLKLVLKKLKLFG